MSASMIMGPARAARRGEVMSYGRRLDTLAAEQPDAPAVTMVAEDGSEREYSYEFLSQASNRTARLLRDRGVLEHDIVCVGLPNCIDHFVTALAVWKLGGCVLPVSYKMASGERRKFLELAQPRVAVADWDDRTLASILVSSADLDRASTYADSALPDIISHPGKAIGSGGSTGRPKIIVDPDPWAAAPGDILHSLGNGLGMAEGQTQLIAGPLYHNAPFCWSHWGLFERHHLVVMQRFNSGAALDLIERHRVNWAFLVPTMMRRMLEVDNVRSRDYTSLTGIWHSAAFCPPWVKRAWLEILGPDRVAEAYGSTESSGATKISGYEWLKRPGSVGRGDGTDIRVLDAGGCDVPPGSVGEVFMRPQRSSDATYRYIGSAPAKQTSDGFVSVGDLGWLDADGYLYLADRRDDLILTGGANVYPAEVEAAILEHPDVEDVAVLGLPDDDWGQKVHAVIQAAQDRRESLASAIDAHCRERLTAYKVPKSFEYVDLLPRDDAGKLRRSGLRQERESERTH